MGRRGSAGFVFSAALYDIRVATCRVLPGNRPIAFGRSVRDLSAAKAADIIGEGRTAEVWGFK